ncbi:hypothetical protein HAX54_038693 [Datura stramonium]|uniref:Uncharacterized protein n=1 Tax=Datura stramonium TaxID=4076 RepID=A0ABS8RMW9_DATST|nr:hypothetical protein [Datura stramonium]
MGIVMMQFKPHLSEGGDAMWCLLMSDLHVGQFHDGWGFGSGGANDFSVNGFFSYASESSLQREMECPKRRNVAIFATGYRANSKYLQNQSQASCDSLLGGHLPS